MLVLLVDPPGFKHEMMSTEEADRSHFLEAITSLSGTKYVKTLFFFIQQNQFKTLHAKKVFVPCARKRNFNYVTKSHNMEFEYIYVAIVVLFVKSGTINGKRFKNEILQAKVSENRLEDPLESLGKRDIFPNRNSVKYSTLELSNLQ